MDSENRANKNQLFNGWMKQLRQNVTNIGSSVKINCEDVDYGKSDPKDTGKS